MLLSSSAFKTFIFSLFLFASSAHADWRESLPDARLLGSGELRMYGFAIYQANFWSTAEAAELEHGKAPFALELTYRRSISRDELVKASLKEIKRLRSGDTSPASLEKWKQEMMLAFVDVKAGDRIIGVFLPGEGAHFYAGDKLQHQVKDEAFAQAFFAIWLDPRTSNPKLRSQLLGSQ